MRTLLTLVLCIVLTLGAHDADTGKHWALLVAGSNGWANYRHQVTLNRMTIICDIQSTYTLEQMSVSKKRLGKCLIEMNTYEMNHAYNSSHIAVVTLRNPLPGIIVNRLGGADVYGGVPRDYTGSNVNPEVFLNVLTGKKEFLQGIGSGKVINSGPNDHVFVNFVDHGAPGLVAFGTQMLYARDLIDAIQEMKEKNRYKKLVFYLEACEAGSMFENILPDDINVYATTASNAQESSYACYFDQLRQTYLGDVYSVKWMEDSDNEDLTKETLQKQFNITKERTTTSHVMEYGDLSIGSLAIAEFLGNMSIDRSAEPNDDACADGVRSEDVPVAILERSLKLAKTEKEKQELQARLDELLKERQMVRQTFESIVTVAHKYKKTADNILKGERQSIHDWDCYESTLKNLVESCPQLNIPQNDYALRHLYILVNMCETNTNIEVLHEAIDKVCGDKVI